MDVVGLQAVGEEVEIGKEGMSLAGLGGCCDNLGVFLFGRLHHYGYGHACYSHDFSQRTTLVTVVVQPRKVECIILRTACHQHRHLAAVVRVDGMIEEEAVDAPGAEIAVGYGLVEDLADVVGFEALSLEWPRLVTRCAPQPQVFVLDFSGTCIRRDAG